MLLSKKLTREEVGEFLKEFNLHTKIGYVVLMIFSYYSLFKLYVSYDLHYVNLILFCILIPVLANISLSALQRYIFASNTFRMLFMMISIITFFYLIIGNLSENNFSHPDRDGVTDFLIILMTLTFGAAAYFTALALPFKSINSIMYNKPLFYDGNMLDRLKDYVKFSGDEEKSTKEELQYSNMNETQLQVALNNALADEDYESAEIIKNILKEKF